VIRNQNKVPQSSICVNKWYIDSSASNQMELFSTPLVPLGRGERRRQKNGCRRQDTLKEEGREKSILRSGIQNKGYLRIASSVSFRRDLYLWGEEKCRRHKCVKKWMEERCEKSTATRNIKRENTSAPYADPQIHTTRQLMASDGWRTCHILHESMRHSVASAASPTTSPC
jgi:hypothetical protein